MEHSVWKKAADWIAPVPNIDYMQAIDELNGGEINCARASLHKN
ncbi:hypothetical protein [Coxiella-like endosymbiont]|nr:hypothetical protein [Coxiella-like endosymbiont]